jgi:hypothetical protein
MVILYIYSTCWHMKLMFYEHQQGGADLMGEEERGRQRFGSAPLERRMVT